MPRVTVLHLDTRFPRPPGDIGCAETFTSVPDIVRIKGATARAVVSHEAETFDLHPFIDALRDAKGDIITTSCGFLAPHQSRLQAATGKPVVASALSALPALMARYDAENVAVLTFNADAALALLHHTPVKLIGLPEQSHLRQVIERDLPTLDTALAETEIVELLRARLPNHIRVLLLECTNLPPYKPAIRQIFDGEIVDILTSIEAACSGTIDPAFL